VRKAALIKAQQEEIQSLKAELQQNRRRMNDALDDLARLLLENEQLRV
jgi:hypothetical protein